ncbi:MAG: DUF1648 domain-containing protein [Eubacteriales bacterium]|jgi:uncharacterized membrane protein
MTPIPELSPKKWHWVADGLCCVVMAGTLLWLWRQWPYLPEQLPSHYNLAGQVDRMADKWTIWICPLLGVAFFVLFGFLERKPKWWNTGVRVTEENASRVYGAVLDLLVLEKVGCCLLLEGLSWYSAQGGNLPGWGMAAILALTLGPLVVGVIRLWRAR